jgi:hypothetical protein
MDILEFCLDEIKSQFKKGKTRTNFRVFDLNPSQKQEVKTTIEDHGYHCHIDDADCVTVWTS